MVTKSKFTSGVWVDGNSSDSEFINAIQFLIEDKIIIISPTEQVLVVEYNEIRYWIKITIGV